jgi:hypothetical protein
MDTKYSKEEVSQKLLNAGIDPDLIKRIVGRMPNDEMRYLSLDMIVRSLNISEQVKNIILQHIINIK